MLSIKDVNKKIDRTNEAKEVQIDLKGNMVGLKASPEVNKVVSLKELKANKGITNSQVDVHTPINDSAELYTDNNPLPFLFPLPNGEYSIDYEAYHNYLTEQGFYKYESGKGFIIVQNQHNIIKEIQIHELKNYLYNKSINANEKSFLMKNEGRLFSESKLAFLTPLEIVKSHDSRENTFFFFQNGYVIVGKDKIELKDYSTLDFTIWENQLIKRDINIIDDEERIMNGEFCKLLINICNDDKERFFSLFSAIGYLLNSYSDPANTKAIIFMDEKIPDVPTEANGGTGKSLVGKAISMFKTSTVEVDGQKFDFRNTFAYQSLNHDTQLLFINDASRKFDFEKLFSAITEGFTVEKKNKLPFRVKGVKVLLTTNFTVIENGESFTRRKYEVEFSDHYNAQNTPMNEFGHILFEEWDSEQWNLFDNLMIIANQFYLANGLMTTKEINLDKRRIIDSTNIEFYNFIEDKNLELNQEYSKRILYTNFTSYYMEEEMSKNLFTSYLKKFSSIKGWDLNLRRGTGNIDQIFWFSDGTKTKPKKFIKRELNKIDKSYKNISQY